ncbi:MAG: hypothetical protein ABSH03_09445 [Candidatus Lustribacter sp.]|jgi:hypothetical protein
MTKRYGGAALGFALALLCTPVRAAPTAAPRATTVPKAIVAPAAETLAAASDLYSPRARRLVRSYLRLQMLELRKAELDRVRAVIEGRIGVDALFSPAPAPPVGRAAGR